MNISQIKIQEIANKLKENEWYTFIGNKDIAELILNEYKGESVRIPYDFRISKHNIWMLINYKGDLLVQKPLNSWDFKVCQPLNKKKFTLNSLLKYREEDIFE